MKIIERHPLWLRIVHWMNVPLLLLMIWSGLLIYWAHNAYPLFFPQWFYDFLGIPYRLAEGLAFHFTVAWLFVINASVYFVAVIGTRHWKKTFPKRNDLSNLLKTLLEEIKPQKNHRTKTELNPAQKLAYTGIVLVGLIEILTGFAIYKPIQLSALVSVFGGYQNARLIHFGAMMAFVGFVLIHVLQVARAGWNHFRAMVAGFQIQEDSENGK